MSSLCSTASTSILTDLEAKGQRLCRGAVDGYHGVRHIKKGAAIMRVGVVEGMDNEEIISLFRHARDEEHSKLAYAAASHLIEG
jgi:hypothetical protein